MQKAHHRLSLNEMRDEKQTIVYLIINRGIPIKIPEIHQGKSTYHA